MTYLEFKGIQTQSTIMIYQQNCKGNEIWPNMMMGISGLSCFFSGISVERFIGVLLPLHYLNIFTKGRVTAFMVGLIIYPVVFSLPTITGEMRWVNGQECEFFLVHGQAFLI